MNQTGAIYGSVGLDDLRSLVLGGPAPLFATISGAHLYGFLAGQR